MRRHTAPVRRRRGGRPDRRARLRLPRDRRSRRPPARQRRLPRRQPLTRTLRSNLFRVGSSGDLPAAPGHPARPRLVLSLTRTPSRSRPRPALGQRRGLLPRRAQLAADDVGAGNASTFACSARSMISSRSTCRSCRARSCGIPPMPSSAPSRSWPRSGGVDRRRGRRDRRAAVQASGASASCSGYLLKDRSQRRQWRPPLSTSASSRTPLNAPISALLAIRTRLAALGGRLGRLTASPAPLRQRSVRDVPCQDTVRRVRTRF